MSDDALHTRQSPSSAPHMVPGMPWDDIEGGCRFGRLPRRCDLRHGYVKRGGEGRSGYVGQAVPYQGGGESQVLVNTRVGLFHVGSIVPSPRK
jgi:hypothetical protein